MGAIRYTVYNVGDIIRSPDVVQEKREIIW